MEQVPSIDRQSIDGQSTGNQWAISGQPQATDEAPLREAQVTLLL
jgi:hypothetical protein